GAGDGACLRLIQLRNSLSFLERLGWLVAVARSRSLASARGESSLLPPLRLSPRSRLRGGPKTAPWNLKASAPASVQKVLQFLAAAGVAQFSEGLGLDLADALPGDVEFLAHFLQGAGAAVLNAEAELQHLLLPGSQGGEYVHQLLLQQGKAGGLAGLAGP